MSVAQAEASLQVLAAQMAREHPDVNAGFSIRLAPAGLMGNLLRKPFMGFGAGLLMVCGLTLLAACLNLSGLLLAHGADRRKELAIRLAIGADQAAIVRLLLMESLLLALAGGVVALIVTVWLRNAIQALMPAMDFPLNTAIALDWRVAAFAFAIALLTAFLFGLLPALSAARVDLAPTLKNDAAGFLRGIHLRDIYVGLQVALSMVLLAGSAMMIRTLAGALTVRYGFDPDHAVALSTDLQMAGYRLERGRAFQQRLAERVRELPGVEAAGIGSSIPFSLNESNSAVQVEGQQTLSLSRMPSAVTYNCGPGYFRALGMRLLAGRDFDDHDRPETTPVAIVNETFVRKLLPNGNAIGKRFRFGLGGSYYQIVGIVEAGKYQTITEDPRMAVWRPLGQNYDNDTTVVARTRGSEQETLAAIRQTIREMDPDMAVFETKTLRQYMDLPLSPLRVATGSLVSMGALGLLLSALGLYGLLAHSIVRRTREIAIRMALGAGIREVLAAVLARAALLYGISVAVGGLLSLAAMRLLGSLLYAQTDPLVYVAAGLVLGVAAGASCVAPARRALRIDPAVALRSE
jgi:predicted permease